MTQPDYLPVFELTRGETVESVHFGTIAVVDTRDRLLAWVGNPQAVTFLRSSAKPLQAIPLIENGGVEAYQLTDKEIAILCASHAGTDEHVATLQAIQAKVGITENDLLCGLEMPGHPSTAEALRQRGEKPTPNRHNCSGNHTGILAYQRLKQARSEQFPAELPYTDPHNPVQVDILATFAEMCGISPAEVQLGTDGCSIPTFAVPLRNAALAYARLCDPTLIDACRATACRKITASMLAHPDMVGGPDSFDTRLMRVAQGRVVSKGGAEGYQALGIFPGALSPASPAMGVAIKISDGDLGGHSVPPAYNLGHARPAVAMEVLRQLGLLTDQETASLSGYGPSFTIFNARKIGVGVGRPCFSLEL